jgi:Uma2 family endonuclease
MGYPASDRASVPMTAEEYLAWEAEQKEKHELHDGEVFAMAGGSPRHNLLAMSAGAELRGAMRGRGCQVLSSDQRVKLGESYVYPDVVVACGGVKTEGATLSNPSIVVEVLSASTEAFDRGEKWSAYRSVSTLTDYLLVSQGTARVEHYRRSADTDDSWHYRVVESGGLLHFSNGGTLSVDAIYEGAFDVPGDAPRPPDARTGSDSSA